MITYVVLSNSGVQYVTGSALKSFEVGKYLKENGEKVEIQIWENEEFVHSVNL
jgi:hypothetical protein